MVSCPRCGANIDPSALACPYCKTQTLYGRQQQEQHAAYQYQAAQVAQHQQAAERHQRQQALEKMAKHALFWSLGGLLVCCLPGAIVGIVMGLSVKSAAKRDGVTPPSMSTIAVVLGACGIAVFGVFLVLFIQDSRARDARIAVLQSQLEATRTKEAIDQPLACALTELELLQDGYAGKGGITVEGVECNGRVEQNGDRAILREVRFRTSSTEKHTVTACLARGARWAVKELRDDESCQPKAAAAPSTSAR